MKRAIALATAALAVAAALTGCGAHARAADRLNSVGHDTSTGTQPGQPAPSATGGTATGTDTSTAAQLASVDDALNGIDRALSGIDDQIAQADQGSDSDSSGMAVLSGSPSAASLAGPTSPSPHAGLDAWKAFVTTRIDLRLATLAALKIAVNGATNLTSSHRATLSGLISSDTDGLTALRTKTNGETTVAAVKADGREMVVDYRIYMLVVPKMRFTVAGDAEAATIARLRTVHDTLVQVATKLAGEGKDVSKENAQLADMASKLDAATAALDGQIDTLLAVAPSPDPDAMRAAVSPVRTAVRGARDDIRAAILDARQARLGLKALS
ncbi:MAG TPA: hypothetical protein VKB69_08000 [Micromonosporaceae bacterium]|nr:hypothetical protein [Micromonosporaceae bacterium]